MSNPYMKFFVGDYLSDTQHLTTEQHGAYLLLLMAMWKSGGRLPNDRLKLARIARVHPPHWARIAPTVMEFFTIEGGEITQKRLAAEIEKASAVSRIKARAGAKGGKARGHRLPVLNTENDHQDRQSSGPILDRKGLGKPMENNDLAEAGASNVLGDTRAGLPQPQPIGSLREQNAREQYDSLDDEFATVFWPEYPHKVGRPEAQTAFRKARLGERPRGKPPRQPATLDAIMEGLRRYVAGHQPDRQWLNPASFLNQDRWTDRPAPSPLSPPRAPPPPPRNPFLEVAEEIRENPAWKP